MMINFLLLKIVYINLIMVDTIKQIQLNQNYYNLSYNFIKYIDSCPTCRKKVVLKT